MNCAPVGNTVDETIGTQISVEKGDVTTITKEYLSSDVEVINTDCF